MGRMPDPTLRAADGPRTRLQGLRLGLLRWPGGSDWRRSLPAVGVLLLGFPVAITSGLLAPGAMQWGWRLQVLPFLFPALLEEVLFRGLLLPHPRLLRPWRRRAPWWVASLLLYVGAHPLLAATVRHAARGVFDAPAFLLEATLLGAAATLAWERSGSLWPAVLLHGAVVALWLSLGGAAQLGRGP